MGTKINNVWIDDTEVYIETEDGKVFGEKFEDYPRLRYATPTQRAAFEYNNVYIRWEELDEDLSIEGFIKKSKPAAESPSTEKFVANEDR